MALDDAAVKFLNVAAARLGWSARSTHRALKVARTIADLAGSETTQISHLAEAMQYRRTLQKPQPLQLLATIFIANRAYDTWAIGPKRCLFVFERHAHLPQVAHYLGADHTHRAGLIGHISGAAGLTQRCQ